MVVPSRVLRALAAAAVVLGTAGAATSPAAGTADRTAARSPAAATATPTRAAEADDSPLQVTITGLTPGVVPRSGPLVVTGTVTNDDVEGWREVNLYPLFSVGSPCTACAPVMTTPADLASGAATDVATQVGERYTDDERVRASAGDLAPGQTTAFTITIPQETLRGLFDGRAAGVYWFGVQALGSSDSSPRDLLSDGRARTFLPYLPADSPVVETAVVLPLRARIVRTPDGAIDRTSSWAEALDPDGRLGGPLAFGAAAGTRALTWLVDPAVPDAVRQLALGNPDRSLAPAPAPTDPGDPAATPAAGDPSSDPAGAPEPSDASPDGADAGADDDPIARAATSWLTQSRALFAAHPVARLPYGDPDLDTVGAERPGLYRIARRHPGAVLDAWGVTGVPVATSPTGRLGSAAISAVDDEATLLLGDQMFPAEDFSATPPVDGLIGRRPVVVTASGAAEGGPQPGDQLSPVALRQRVLSEAAVRSLAAAAEGAGARPQPLTVVLPSQVDATGAAEFWAGLDVSWVRPVGLDSLGRLAGDPARSDASRQIDPADLSTRSGGRVPAAAVGEATRILRASRTLQRLLGEGSTVGDVLAGEALSGLSYAMRGEDDAVSRLAATRRWVEGRLAKVSIKGPGQATLASASGSFNVALRNDLDRPVTVSIVVDGDTGARIEVANPVTIAARSRTSVPVDARMSRPGVHNVVLRLVDSEGEAVGASDRLSLRSGQAGVVIWAIMGTGVTILAGAIALRLRRRIKGGAAPGEPAKGSAG